MTMIAVDTKVNKMNMHTAVSPLVNIPFLLENLLFT